MLRRGRRRGSDGYVRRGAPRRCAFCAWGVLRRSQEPGLAGGAPDAACRVLWDLTFVHASAALTCAQRALATPWRFADSAPHAHPSCAGQVHLLLPRSGACALQATRQATCPPVARRSVLRAQRRSARSEGSASRTRSTRVCACTRCVCRRVSPRHLHLPSCAVSRSADLLSLRSCKRLADCRATFVLSCGPRFASCLQLVAVRSRCASRAVV